MVAEEKMVAAIRNPAIRITSPAIRITSPAIRITSPAIKSPTSPAIKSPTSPAIKSPTSRLVRLVPVLLQAQALAPAVEIAKALLMVFASGELSLCMASLYSLLSYLYSRLIIFFIISFHSNAVATKDTIGIAKTSGRTCAARMISLLMKTTFATLLDPRSVMAPPPTFVVVMQ